VFTDDGHAAAPASDYARESAWWWPSRGRILAACFVCWPEFCRPPFSGLLQQSAPYSISLSGSREHIGSTVRPSVFGRLEVDYELEFFGLINRQLCWFSPSGCARRGNDVAVESAERP
jgi:hypothetical protein